MSFVHPNKSDEIYQSPTIQKHWEIISKMQQNKILDITFDKESNSLYIYEGCDKWFGYRLTSDDCKQLSVMFSELADEIVNMSNKQTNYQKEDN